MAIISTGDRNKIVELYVATFNRAPDADGLAYWVGRFEAGMSLTNIARSFFDQPETQSVYGALDASEIVTRVYDNVLNRAPDAAGLAYWTNELTTGKVSRSDLILAVINAAKSATGTQDDADTLANKTEVGVYFAVTLGLNDLDLAASVMAGVTSDDATVAAATAAADAGTGATYDLKVGEDNLTGTAANDTFNARITTAETLESFDLIDGGGGVDVLNVTLDGGGAVPSITNVEVINVRAASGSYLYGTGLSGVEELWSVNSTGFLNVSDIDLDGLTFGLRNTSADLYISDATGDTLSLAVDGADSSVFVTDVSLDTVSIAVLGDSTLDITDVSDIDTLTIVGTGELDLAVDAADLVDVDASGLSSDLP